MEITGKVIINVLDAETMEVVETIEQSNVITKLFYYHMVNNAKIDSTTSIYLSPSTTPSYEDWCYVPNCVTTGYTPVGVTTPQMFYGADPAYLQVMRRFDAPAVTRSISTVGLYLGQVWPNAISHTDGVVSQMLDAYVKLSAPCTQTTTQILDVYYRVQVSTTGIKNYNNVTMPARYFLEYINTGPGSLLSAYHAPTYANVLPSSNTSPTDSGNLVQFSYTNSIQSNTTTTFSNAWDGAYSQYRTDWSQTTVQGVGVLYGSMVTMVGATASYGFPAITSHNITAPNYSKIQPIFSHANSTLTNTSATHMLDTVPATGSGTYNMGGTWTTGNLPELYKISIVTGGAVGTATYTFEKRNHVGFQGQYYNTDCQVLVGAYNISATVYKKHTCSYLPGTSGSYGSRMEKYDTTHFISYDTTGVSRYNVTNHFVEMWDNTTTPALPATNLRQACVNTSDGSIWAACANTGIYRISADGLTVTNFTTSDGLPSNNCRAIDMGRANTIWAYTDGGLVSSSNSGATWTVYNASTTLAFNSTILTAEPSAVHYMRVDPTHLDDRICIVRSRTVSTNSAVGMIWWNRNTCAVTNANGPAYTVNGDYRVLPAMFNVSDNDGIWVVSDHTSGANYLNTYIITYGYLSSITVIGSGSGWRGSPAEVGPVFVRNSANTQDLLLVYVVGSVWNPGSNNYGLLGTMATYPYYDNYSYIQTTTYNSAGVLVAQHGFAPPHWARSYALGGQNQSNVQAVVYLGNGVLVGYNWHTSGVQCGWITTIYGDGTPSGGALEYLTWDKYGWDGANWVLGNTTPKTTHIGEEPLIHGLTSRFTNGAAGTSFVAGEYYTNSVNDGILKNNAMTTSSWVAQFLSPTEKLTSFDGVIRSYPWTTGLVVWRKASASITINGDGSLTNNSQYRNNQLTACSKQRVFGDFSISGTFSLSTSQRYAIGIKNNFVMEYIVIRPTQVATWCFNIAGAAVTILNASSTAVGTATTITGTTTWNITRVGNTITFYVGGVVKHTTTDASYSFGVNARFNGDTVPSISTINPVTVNSSGVGYYTGMGDSVAGTGIYDTKQLRHVVVNTSDLSINGTPLTVCNATTATPPASGGVSYSQEEGMLFCHSDDVGKTMTGSYIVNYQASTPCNIPPV